MIVDIHFRSLLCHDPQVNAHVSVSSNRVVPKVKPVFNPHDGHARIVSNGAKAGNKVSALPEDNTLPAHVHQQRDVLLKKFVCESIIAALSALHLA